MSIAQWKYMDLQVQAQQEVTFYVALKVVPNTAEPVIVLEFSMHPPFAAFWGVIIVTCSYSSQQLLCFFLLPYDQTTGGICSMKYFPPCSTLPSQCVVFTIEGN